MHKRIRRNRSLITAALVLGLLWASGACKESTTEARGQRRPDDAAAVFRAPSLKGWPGLTVPGAQPALQLSKDYPYFALAKDRELFLYGNTGKKPWIWGKIRLGQRVPVRLHERGNGCSRGNWYVTPDSAYVCNTHGYTISSKPDGVAALRAPAVGQVLPYVYRRAKAKPTLQLERLPTPAELAAADKALAAGSALPAPAVAAKEGAYFIAVDRKVKDKAGSFYLSTDGHYLRATDTAPVTLYPMHGVLLGEQHELPLAFVYQQKTPVSCLSKKKELEACGVAAKHSRFEIERQLQLDGQSYVVSPRRYAVPQAAVRIARKAQRPDEVEQEEKWVHFNLAQQTMVAYEGDRPVFATLISSGKPGHDTPPGSFRVYLKYISDRMSGDDAKDGPYDIAEVPWVMYYKGSFAVHGAYWHEVFGQTRSHGCTNLAPADARWLYYWTEPILPQGWHGQFASKGTVFHFTDG